MRSLGQATAPQSYSIAQVRRNHVGSGAFDRTHNPPAATADDWPDSDGGVMQGTRPYFYSAGPDGLVGVSPDADPATQNPYANFNTDNVYTKSSRNCLGSERGKKPSSSSRDGSWRAAGL